MNQDASNTRHTDGELASTWYYWIAVIVLILSFSLDIWGVRKNLPYIPEVDEPIFVNAAVHIAEPRLNPHWFGNPGLDLSTPSRLRSACGTRFSTGEGSYFLTPIWRYISISPSPRSISSAACSRSPMPFSQSRLPSQLVVKCLTPEPRSWLPGSPAFQSSRLPIRKWAGRTAPALSLPCSSLARLQGNGAEVPRLGYCRERCRGTGISTRYFLLALLAPLGLAILFGRPGKGPTPWDPLRTAIGICAPGALAIVVVSIAFGSASPFFFLDFSQAWHDILIEARQSHLGADGLSPIGNLGWYVSELRADLGLPQAALVVVGAATTILRRNRRQLILLAYVTIFIFGTILSPLHWDRWMIQILPILSLFAADAVMSCVKAMKRFQQLKPVSYPLVLSLAVSAVAVVPGYQVAGYDVGQTLRSTRIQADQWLTSHLPAGSHIAEVWYSAPFPSSTFITQEFPVWRAMPRRTPTELKVLTIL